MVLSYNSQNIKKAKIGKYGLSSLNVAGIFTTVLSSVLIFALGVSMLSFVSPKGTPRVAAIGKNYSVHIVAGQSNAVGEGANAAELPANGSDSFIKFYANGSTTTNGEITNLQPQLLSDGRKIFGPEMTLGRNLAQKSNKNILVIKLAMSGSSMWQDWNSTNGRGWPLFVSEVNSALSKIKANGDTYSIDGFYWMQGESDTGPDSGPAYQASLTKFINDTRTTFSSPNMPFIVGRINAPNQRSIYRDMVRNAQVNLGNTMYKVRWVDTDDLPLDGGNVTGIHYTAAGERELGKRFFNKTWPLMQAKYSNLLPQSSFVDVPATASYKPAVNWATGNRIMFGYSDNTFRPGNTVDRSTVVKFLWRMMDSPVATVNTRYADVPANSDYKAALDWCQQMGVISGFSNNTFRPANIVTKQEMVQYLWKLAGSQMPSARSSFLDVPSTSGYKTAIDWAVEKGIIVVPSNKLFNPTANVTKQFSSETMYALAKNELAWANRSAVVSTKILF